MAGRHSRWFSFFAWDLSLAPLQFPNLLVGRRALKPFRA
jgi:hypothetical protein